MIYGYIRVSTASQDTDAQMLSITRYCEASGIKIDEYVEEKISGTKEIKDRELGNLINKVKEGDTLICSEVSRLGRSMQIINDVMKIIINKKACLLCIKENHRLVDDAISKLIMSIYGYAAETERKLIAERTKEGVDVARKNGKILGRPVGSVQAKHKLDDYHDYIIKAIANGKHKTDIAKKLKCNTCTLYHYMKVWEIQKDIEEYNMAGKPRNWKKYNID